MDSPRLEWELDEIVQAVAGKLDVLSSSVAYTPVAVVLGGGYGRGEGGVLRLPDGEERLYNDLDLFVFIDDAMPSGAVSDWRGALAGIEKELSELHHVEVEFGPPTRLGDLDKLSATLMYQELRRGWRQVWGDGALAIDRIREIPLEKLPLSEGMRLLLNRGAGLLMSQLKFESAEFDRDAADFVNRNQHKAAQAVGDAYLIARGRYLAHGPERLDALEKEKNFPESAMVAYRNALAFKYAPDAEPPEQKVLIDRQRVAELDLLTGMADFFAHGGDQYDGSTGERLRDMAKSLYYFRFLGIRHPFIAPRLRLCGFLVAKLFANNAEAKYIMKDLKPSFRQLVNDFGGVTRERFLALWQHMN